MTVSVNQAPARVIEYFVVRSKPTD